MLWAKKLFRIASRDRWGEAIRRRLVADGVLTSDAVYVPETFAIREGSRSVFLENLFAELHHRWPWQRRAVVTRWVESSREMELAVPDSFEEAKVDLLPALRHPASFKSVALLEGTAAASGIDAASRPLTSNLGAYLALDRPASMRFVGEVLLQRWGVTFETAFEQALENLRNRSKTPLQQVGRGIAVSAFGDSYDASRILLPEVLAQVEAPGDPVAIVPGRSALILTGDRDFEPLAAAMQVALEAWENEPRPVSLLPIVRRAGQWQELVLPRGHACYDLLCELRVREAAQLYDDQTPALQSWMERQGEDVYVAQLIASKHTESGRFNSIAVWSRGVDSLLPRAEQVAFFDPDRKEEERNLALVDFDLVESHLRQAFERTEHVPERFRARSFPPEEAILELRRLQERREAVG